MSDELVARSHGLHVRAVREDRREAEFVASTDALDSYDEVVEQKWDLERFRSNPVVLFAHQSRELPIGVATMCEVLDGKLQCVIRFSSAELNPKAEQVWQNVKAGVLRAVSVGFRPHSYRYEKQNDREVLVLSDNELHEISVVPIPANPEALAKIRTKARADTAAAATSAIAAEPETAMTEKELQEKAAKLESEKSIVEALLSDAKKALDEMTAKATALETQNAALVTERDAANERTAAAIVRADAAESKVIELEVAALVGTKITPAEKDDFIALRKQNPDLYAKFVAQRADKKLLEQTIPTQAKAAPTLGAASEIDLFR